MDAFSESNRLSIQLHKVGIKFRKNWETGWKYVKRYMRPSTGTTPVPTKKGNEYIYTCP
jgi:hypothetical protein